MQNGVKLKKWRQGLDIKEKYEKDINFVFLNVDNPKWEKYIRNFNVNGIPQLNIFDEDANLEVTLIGKQ